MDDNRRNSRWKQNIGDDVPTAVLHGSAQRRTVISYCINNSNYYCNDDLFRCDLLPENWIFLIRVYLLKRILRNVIRRGLLGVRYREESIRAKTNRVLD